RRHTRCLSDWSSDVCSSDLIIDGSNLVGNGTNRFSSGTITLNGTVTLNYVEFYGATLAGTHTFNGTVNWIYGLWGSNGGTTTIRSEERRVGKEGRTQEWNGD